MLIARITANARCCSCHGTGLSFDMRRDSQEGRQRVEFTVKVCSCVGVNIPKASERKKENTGQ
jgi:hypothetical protein